MSFPRKSLLRILRKSKVLAGQKLGITEVHEGLWLVSFTTYDIGFFDEETCRLEPAPNPFGAKVLPMSPE